MLAHFHSWHLVILSGTELRMRPKLGIQEQTNLVEKGKIKHFTLKLTQ